MRPIVELTSMGLRYGVAPCSDHPDVRNFGPQPSCWRAAGTGGRSVVYILQELPSFQAMYVGVTKMPQDRWLAHRREKPWWPRVGWIEVRPCPDREEALEHEAELIRALLPPYNVLTGLRWPGERS